jgi:HPt (histidine-containing phosphotransfer) domain-containing protein
VGGGIDGSRAQRSQASFRGRNLSIDEEAVPDPAFTESQRPPAELARAREDELMRQRSELAASLYEEIRAPLNGIIARAEQLRGSELDREQREHAEALAASAYALLSLLTDFLDVSAADTERLASGRSGVARLDRVHAPSGRAAALAQGDRAQRNGADDVLDETIVAQLKGTLTPSMCAHLLEEFEASLPKLLADIGSAFARNDAGALRRSAHLLRGSSATLGAVRLSDACARLERTRAEDLPIGEQQLAQLRAALEEACVALRGRLA